MILREIFYLDKETLEPQEDHMYDPEDDISPLKISDTRKTRLTLKDINKARRARDKHEEDYQKDLVHVKAMYGAQPGEEAI